jgi:short-subunit dehydrogenase
MFQGKFALYVLLAAIVAYNFYKRFYVWLICKPTFTGKTVLVTGGSSGLGEQMAKRFVELGAKKVIIAARNMKELMRVKGECKYPDRVVVMQMDLSKPEECMKKASELQEGTTIDILVNNGGLSMREEFVNCEFSTCEYMMNTNCLSHIALVKALLPSMIASKKGGNIVNILSISGLMGVPVRTMYCASKFAMDGFSKALRSEVKHYGI